MNLFDVYRELPRETEGKIVLVVFDGLGGLPREAGGPTELEDAQTPNLDALAADGSCGLLDNVLPGLTPGSGPAHLGLFGYDPLVYDIGRGILSALGIGFPVQVGDLCARINLCTLHPDSRIVLDRRAGRIASELSRPLIEKLDAIELPDCEVHVRQVKEYRACLVLRAPDLYDDIDDTDPQSTWEETPLPVAANDERSEKAADLVRQFAREAEAVLGEHFADAADALRGEREDVEAFIAENHPANGLMLRGFARYEKLPHLDEIFGIRAAAIATYPMYKGVASLVGMDVLEVGSEEIADEFACLEQHFSDYDLFFLHIKKCDSYGEDGNWDAKVHVIEEGDGQIPRARALDPAVLCVTADHSTPCVLKSHSWHPVPCALWSRWGRRDAVEVFSESACAGGGLGRMRGIHLMPTLVAHALGFEKYGA
ncbi:MAG: 2,3-bisphosphoglycerate-independent phosphoglycerate mutase [bacterium]